MSERSKEISGRKLSEPVLRLLLGETRGGRTEGRVLERVTMSAWQDEQKAEDELAKKRAAFLLKQQRKAEEARVRKQQLEAEVELKRDEAR